MNFKICFLCKLSYYNVCFLFLCYLLFLYESLLLVRCWTSLFYILFLRRNIEIFLLDIVYSKFIYLLCLGVFRKIFLLVLYIENNISLDFLIYFESLLWVSYFLRFSEAYLLKESLLFDGSKSFLFYVL